MDRFGGDYAFLMNALEGALGDSWSLRNARREAD